MKKCLFVMLMLLPMMASAAMEDAEIDGIWYSIDLETQTATVIAKQDGGYSGDLKIPNKVLYNQYWHEVVSIGDVAFYKCAGVTSVVIPETVKSIGNQAFSDCTGLCSITIPHNVTTIDSHAFENCKSLSIVTFSEGLTLLGDGAFENCTSLRSIDLPNSLTTIGSRTFAFCSRLQSVKIPESITSIGMFAFVNCSSLSSITLPEGLTQLGYGAFQSSGITSVLLPDKLTFIDKNTFMDCRGLSSVYLGSGVNEISEESFRLCVNLKDIYSNNTTVITANPNTFYEMNTENVTLHVPYTVIDGYKGVSPWNQFGKIIGLDIEGSDDENSPKCANPVISYKSGEILFSCETEGVVFVSEITPLDSGKEFESKITLSNKYRLKVYSTKDGYRNSDIVEEEIDIRGEMGDVNGDGVVDAADVVKVTNIIMGKN